MKKLMGRIILCLGAVASTSIAEAAFDFAPAQTEKQKAFVSSLRSSNFESALLTWDQAFSGTSFYRSSMGRSLFAYLLAKNGFPLTGVEILFRTKDPSYLPSELVQLWKIEVNRNPILPDLSRTRLSPAWQKIFAIQERDAFEKQWQKALDEAIQWKSRKAISTLEKLLESKAQSVGSDRLYLALARAYYQNQDFPNAIANYKNISQKSDYWFEAKEEIAWAYLAQGEHGNSMAELKTLQAPMFSPYVGPEPYLLNTLIQLKICDYASLFDNLKNFKTRHRERIQSIQTLAKNPQTPLTTSVIEKMTSYKASWQNIGADIQLLPRLLLRDAITNVNFTLIQLLRRETKAAQKLEAKFAQLEYHSSVQDFLEGIPLNSERREESVRTRVYQRIQFLAARDVKEYSTIINRLHLLEAEAIQRMTMREPLKEVPKNPDLAQSGEVLKFPEGKEVWLDELDNYQMKTKGCPGAKGKTL